MIWLRTIIEWIIIQLLPLDYDLLVKLSPAIVAIIAIYYAYLNEGKITVGLLNYCICDKQNVNDFYIELPLGFYNTGATGKIIMGLRIKFKKDNWTSKPLYCEHVLNDIGIGGKGDLEKTRKWMTPFIIEPRRGYTDCFSFSVKKRKENIKLSKGEYKIILEAKFVNKKNWENIDIIDFYIGGEHFNCMTVYPNDPDFFAFSYGTNEDSK
ncbi:MAG: hypothetical protein WAW52_10115 [Methanothrix sp.]